MLGSIWDFAGCLVSCCSSLLYFVPFGVGVDFMQMGQCSSHLHTSVGLLLWGLFSTRVQGMAANLGGVFSSAFSILITVGASVGVIGEDALALNRFVEAAWY